MFTGLAGEFGIEKVLLRLTTVDERLLRTVPLTLSHAFDDDLADVLGTSGKKAKKCLADGSYKKVEMPIDAIKAIATISNGDRTARVQVDSLIGIRAVGSAGSDAGEDPKLDLTFECSFEQSAWAFFGLECGAMVWIDLIPKQTELDFDGPQAAPADGVAAPKPKRARKTAPPMHEPASATEIQPDP